MSYNKRKNKNKVPDAPVPAHRLKATSKVMVIVFVLLASKIGWIQFVQGAELKEKASRQQTLNKIISPQRGGIYDTNEKLLAGSKQVDTISINPSGFIIKDDDPSEAKKKTLENQQKVARALSDIFTLDYEETLAKVQSEKKIEVIAKQVDKELVDKLKDWQEKNKVTAGINIDPDTKRYYPYNNLASHVLGFTGTDAQGLYGIECSWDGTLKGTSRKNSHNGQRKWKSNFR